MASGGGDPQAEAMSSLMMPMLVMMLVMMLLLVPFFGDFEVMIPLYMNGMLVGMTSEMLSTL